MTPCVMLEEDVLFLSDMQEAVWHERKLDLRYGQGTSTVQRTVDSLGLVAIGRIHSGCGRGSIR
jgi:hypothetical protein